MAGTRRGGVVLAVALLAAVAFSQHAAGQAPQGGATPTKFAFVLVQRALASTEEGKARLKDLDTWAQPRQEELGKLDKEINDLKGEMITKQGVANEEAIGDLNRRLVVKQREFEDRQRIAKRDFESRRQGLLKELGGKLQEVINKYAADNQLAVVFIINPDQLAYLAPSVDITETVIKLYNERYPLGPAPAK
jgi:outer membrane protein